MRTSKDKDRDGSRKENAGCTNGNITARRKTMLFNPKITPASINGRRKTVFTEIPEPPKKPKKGAASTSIYPSGALKTLPTVVASNKNKPKPTLQRMTSTPLHVKATTKEKITGDLLAPKSKDCLKYVPHREHWSASSNQSLFSRPHQERRSSLYRPEKALQRSTPSLDRIVQPSTHKHNSPSNRSDSSSHRSDSSSHRRDSSSHRSDSSLQQRDASTHRRDSSSHQRDSSTQKRDSSTQKRDSLSHRSASSSKSKRHSASSESSANHSLAVPDRRATKRQSSKDDDGHPKNNAKKIRLIEFKFENSVVETGPDKSVNRTLNTVKKTSETLNNTSNLQNNSEIRKQSKSNATKEVLVDKMKPKSSSHPKDAKRVGSKVTLARDRKDPALNPMVKICRLKIDSSKGHEKSKREINVRDDSYAVYAVDGKFRIKTKKKDRRDSKSEKQQARESVGRAEVIETHTETCDFSQQTDGRAFSRNIGVQKFDKEAAKQAKKSEESISLFKQSSTEYEAVIRDLDNTIATLRATMNEKENTISERERMIAERDLRITEREQMIADRDIRITDRDKKIKEYEEIIKLKEIRYQAMVREMNELRQSNENLSKLLPEKETISKDKPAPEIEASDCPKLQLRLKNIKELVTDPRNASPPTNALTNETRNPTPPLDGCANGIGPTDTPQINPYHPSASTQPSCTQFTQYLRIVSPSGLNQYMLQNTTQPTTTASFYGTQTAIPATSIPTVATPHQNLPKIIQRSAAQNVSFDRGTGLSQGGINQAHTVSQIRNRANTCYYGSRPMFQRPLPLHQPLSLHRAIQQHQLLTPLQPQQQHQPQQQNQP